MDIQRLKELCMIPGISSREEKVRNSILSKINPENHMVDDIGNLIIPKGKGKRLLLMAHMDEIGFHIINTTRDGKLFLRKVGGIPDEIIQSRFIDIITSSGTVKGIIGSVPPHLKKDGLNFELLADVGVVSREELKMKNIEIMDYAVFSKEFHEIGEFVSCRALDDRFGCHILEEVYKKSNPKNEVLFAWTVQEEIGLKGAKALSNSLSDISLAIAVDSFACCSKQNNHIIPGKGPVIRFVDNSGIVSYKHAKKIMQIANEKSIPVQIGSTGGGTDASIFVEKGIPMVALSVAVKYLHSTVEMVHKNDLENLEKLIIAIVEEGF
ncbi:M28 family peptidase [Thermosipho ferrireducens]|uniref:M28 family peptidase n=1 Tax=Thermosipho ferrireducens TaxID=2571116 RepID=A0ABX7S5K0_9BACT|nr:M28 family peptidase [Thermosipho ferrireducens]QTA37824.1 M28 family peptidase [Thermosipho ferrireducens]